MATFINFCVLLFLCYIPFNAAVFSIHHAGISRKYMQIRKEEPSHRYRLHNQVSLCNEALRTNTFFYIAQPAEILGERQSLQHRSVNELNLQLQQYYHSLANPDRLKYSERTAILDFRLAKVKVFLCADIKGIELYLTHEFREGYFFIFTKRRSAYDSYMKIGAMMKPSPILKVNLSRRSEPNGQRALENNFWHYLTGVSGLRKLNPQTPTNMNLCFLSREEYKYVEICSAVADSLSKTYNRDLQLHIRKSNYIRRVNRSSNCVNLPIMNFGMNLMVRARALPCAINTDWSSPQFYLLRDPTRSASVFVLQRDPLGLKLFAYVEHVTALRNA